MQRCVLGDEQRRTPAVLRRIYLDRHHIAFRPQRGDRVLVVAQRRFDRLVSVVAEVADHQDGLPHPARVQRARQRVRRAADDLARDGRDLGIVALAVPIDLIDAGAGNDVVKLIEERCFPRPVEQRERVGGQAVRADDARVGPDVEHLRAGVLAQPADDAAGDDPDV